MSDKPKKVALSVKEMAAVGIILAAWCGDFPTEQVDAAMERLGISPKNVLPLAIDIVAKVTLATERAGGADKILKEFAVAIGSLDIEPLA